MLLPVFDKLNAKVEHVIAGFLLLALAYLVVLGFPGTVNIMHVNTWFFNYEFGYLNRALMGSLFQFVHGPTTVEKFYKYVPIWDKCILAVIMSLFWAMFIPRIWMSNISYQHKWLFMAFAAVPMLSPIWKEVGSQVGQLDEYVLLWVLLAFFCFLFNRPVGYLCCIAPAFAVHPQAFIYAFLMLMLIAHAVVRNPDHAARWRSWALVSLLSLCIPVLLGLLHSAEHSLSFIEMNRDELLKILSLEWFESSKADYGSADSSKFASGHFGALWRLHAAFYSVWPYTAILGIIGYALPIFVYAFLFSRTVGKAAETTRTNFLIFNHPFLARLIPYEHYIIIIGSALFVFPTLFLGDWGRVIYWSWFRVGIASAYFLWFCFQTGNIRKKNRHPKGKRRRKNKFASYLFSAFIALWAYTFAGAPLVLGNLLDPNIYNCKNCGHFVPFLNRHALGDLYSETVYRLLVMGNASDVRIYPEDMFYPSAYYYLEYPLELKKNGLYVPADFKGEIWHQYIRLPGRQNISFILEHESNSSNRVKLNVNNHVFEPASTSADKTIWRIQGHRELSLVRFGLVSHKGKELRIIGLDIEFEETDDL